MSARSYTHTSNRTKARIAVARKDVFKSVLENPFRIQWPSIPSDAQDTFLVTLLTSLQSTGIRKTIKAGANKVESSKSFPASENSTRSIPASPFDYITIGINEVTRKLESQIESFRMLVTITTPSRVKKISRKSAPIAVVFVCRADVNPPILIDHIPHLVAGCNSIRPKSDPQGAQEPLKLIVLPKGSEPALAQALGIRRAATIAIHGDAPYLPTFYKMFQSVPIISAPWLVPPSQPVSSRSLVPTHIKQLRTTAPKDMKAAKEQRAKARAAAKKTTSSAKPRSKERVILKTAGPESRPIMNPRSTFQTFGEYLPGHASSE